MNKANYIIFHPEIKRKSEFVSATVIRGNEVLKEWKGNVYVDKIGEGNEDPFVFNNPWLFSYCHASQLRRNTRRDSYLQVGSKLFFVSGQHADEGFLTIDTYFLIGGVQKWKQPILELPQKYESHFENLQSELWRRHFQFPFDGVHKTVSYTYEAEIWEKTKNEFSFLPLNKNGERVCVSFKNLSNPLSEKILAKRKGKYPVLLEENEANEILQHIERGVFTKVVCDITINLNVNVTNKRC